LKIQKGPKQFIYYMSHLEDSPCEICLVQPLCSKSFLDDTACADLSNYIKEKTEEIQNENKN
jgi:hypothetical protein